MAGFGPAVWLINSPGGIVFMKSLSSFLSSSLFEVLSLSNSAFPLLLLLLLHGFTSGNYGCG